MRRKILKSRPEEFYNYTPASMRKTRKNLVGYKKYLKQNKAKRFSAFEVVNTTLSANGRKVRSREIVAPETGIHSRAWAEQIVPQDGFLRLPFEIRLKIYTILLTSAPIRHPRKNGTTYTSANPLSPTKTIYLPLSLICRQIYVDVVGSSLLYCLCHFCFSSADTMTRYLACINPAHRVTIRNISLSISIYRTSPKLPSSLFRALAMLPSLQKLRLKVAVPHEFIRAGPIQSVHPTIRNNLFYAGRTCEYRFDEKLKANLLEKKNQWEGLEGRLDEFKIKFDWIPAFLDGEKEEEARLESEIAAIVMKR